MRHRGARERWGVTALVFFFMVAFWAHGGHADIVVEPQNVALGTYTLGPGQTLGPLQFTISVASTDNETKEFVAASNASWLTLEPANGDIPGTITGEATVSATMQGSYTAEVTVTGVDDNGIAKGTQTIRVSLTVTRTTGSSLSISPNFVDLGTLRLLPDEEYGPSSFTVSISGGPTPPEGMVTTFTASSDQPWLQVNPATGNVPGTTTVSVTVSETMVGEFLGTLTITTSTPTPTGDQITGSGTVIVKFTVERVIGNLLTVSPSVLEVEFTTQDLSPQVFPLQIRNADPTFNDYDWSAEVLVPWLRVDPVYGHGNTTATLTVDPRLVPLTLSLEAVEGKIIFRSSMHPDPVEVMVRLRVVVVSNETLSVYPSYLYWSLQKSAEGFLETVGEEILSVASQNDGWIVWTDVPYVVLTNLEMIGGVLMGSGVGTRLSVRLDLLVLNGYGYGRWEGRIYVSNLSGTALRVVPVIVDIRKPGDPVTPPLPPNLVLQSSPGYVLVETVDTAWFEMLLSAPQTVVRYSSAASCQAAGGKWIDPDGFPGTLDEMCSLDEKVYVLASVPDAIPGRVYVLSAHCPGGLTEAYLNGVPLPGADQWYYAAGPVPYIPIGPLQLLGLYGRIHVSVRVGSDLSSAREGQRVQINVRTVEGSWLVTETYQGTQYYYGPERPLVIQRQPGSPSYTGTWDGVTITCRPGDGTQQLYVMDFVDKGVQYQYEINRMSADKMSGRWRFAYDGRWSTWEKFEASRWAFGP